MLDNRRQLIVKYARECVGTPFMHQGRQCGAGLDCIGVVCHVADKLGVIYDDIISYSEVPRPILLRESIEKYMVEISEEEAQPGDIVLMRCNIRKIIVHVGVLTDHGIVHALHDVGKVVETVNDANPLYKIVGHYSL